MKKLYAFLFIALFSTISFSQDSGFVPGQLLVMVSSNEDVQKIETELSSLNFQATALKAKQLLSKRLHAWLFEFNPAVDHFKMLDALKKHPLVIIAQSNHYVYDRVVPNDT